MAFVSNDMELVEVNQVAEKNVIEYRIYGMNIRIDPNNSAGLMIIVDFGQGYVDEEGQFISVKRSTHKLEGGPILAAVTAQVTEGNNRYDEIKMGIWDTLQIEGIIPSGTIE